MKNKIIDEFKISELLNKYNRIDSSKLEEILAKALELKGLDSDDVACLLSITEKPDLDKLFYTANRVKEEIYGNRLVLFAPLYVSNYCSNNCLYCGFRVDNKTLTRTKLDLNQIKDETKAILEQGHKRILLLMGEHSQKSPLSYCIDAIEAIYSVKDSKGSSIRRINLEIAPLDDSEFIELSKVPIGTYTVFQETYHKTTYEQMHPSGEKSDYNWRLETMDRALNNGMHDVGIGALFGLYDYRFEVLALIEHARHLDETFNIGPHTISIPRIKPAINAPASTDIPHSVSDEDFRKLVAIIRCAVPYTGIILSTRESVGVRQSLFNLGVSQISAGSRTNPGGYKQRLNEADDDDGQFHLNDCRSSGEVISDVIRAGFIPSFCTSCYRLGRVGQDFMDQAKPGLIKLFCHPNGLTTLKEYLMDYADEQTRLDGEALIEKELDNIPNENVRNKTKEFLNKIENGERDLYL